MKALPRFVAANKLAALGRAVKKVRAELPARRPSRAHRRDVGQLGQTGHGAHESSSPALGSAISGAIRSRLATTPSQSQP